MTSRRFFLKGTAVAAAGAALPGCDALLWPDLRSVAEAMAGLLNRRELARETGRRYLEAVDSLDGTPVDAVAGMILDDIGMITDGVMFLDVDELRDKLDAGIRHDFAAEKTVGVDGWLLSRTECLLCAVAYLLPGRAG